MFKSLLSTQSRLLRKTHYLIKVITKAIQLLAESFLDQNAAAFDNA